MIFRNLTGGCPHSFTPSQSAQLGNCLGAGICLQRVLGLIRQIFADGRQSVSSYITSPRCPDPGGAAVILLLAESSIQAWRNGPPLYSTISGRASLYTFINGASVICVHCKAEI